MATGAATTGAVLGLTVAAVLLLADAGILADCAGGACTTGLVATGWAEGNPSLTTAAAIGAG